MNAPDGAATRPGRSVALRWSVVSNLALFAALACCGWLLLATHFMPYDDEGYVLWSVRGFCEGNPLYAEVFSQYGPLFFLGYRALHAVSGLVFDNDSGRALTLVYWLLAAGFSGAIARRLARSRVAGAVATALAFVLLAANRQEPFHPGSLLAALVSTTAYVGVRGILAGRESTTAWQAALIVAAALLIKINVGTFLLVALGGWMLANARAQGAGPRMALIAGACAGPFLVVHGSWADPRALVLAIAVATGTLPLAIAMTSTRRGVFGPAAFLGAAGILVAAGAATTAIFVHWGTSPRDLLEGALLGPLRHPTIYSSLVRPPWFMPAVVLLPLGFGAWLAVSPGTYRTARSPRGIALAASTAAILPLVFASQAPPPELLALFLAAPLGALIVLPETQDETTPEARAMIWLAWILAWQVLHAYPVTGSQAAWGAFLLAPLAVAGWWRGLERLRAPGRGLLRIGRGLAVLACAIAAARLAAYGVRCLHNSFDPELPGARSLRLEPGLGQVLSVLRANLATHGGTVFSLPGMFSFNIWAGKPTPTDANVTHWFSLLGPEKQQAIVDRLRSDPLALVVVQRSLLEFLATRGRHPEGPLAAYIENELVPVLRADGYELRAHPGRDIGLLQVFRIQGRELIASPLPGTVRPVTARLLYRDAQNRPFEISLTPLKTEAAEGAGVLRFPALPGPLPPGATASRLFLQDAHGQTYATLVADTLRESAR